jgi:MFS transporter, DHA1 family, multidrug resistance protein
MAPFGDRAGAASALLGTLQFTLAGVSSVTVAHLPLPPVVAMAGVITACGIAAQLLLRLAARPDQPPG